MSARVYLADAAATEALGARIARMRPLRGMLYLDGPLGAGKTTLVRGLVRALGVTGPVRSPTFTLVEPYACEGARVYHFDLYRLSDPEELEYLGARDYFAQDALCLVEWPERGRGYLPAADLRLRMGYEGSGRWVDCQTGSALGEGYASLAGCAS